MINNRQGGRRRGRGGQRPQGMTDRSGGNRQDNRQRGNAAQLLEKYKALARDSQLAGDRVQTEYYLQFADHYFRVLEDGRSRFEEQNQRRPRDGDDGDGDDEMAGAEGESDGDDDGEEQRPAPRRDRAPQRDRNDQEQRPQRADQEQRPPRADQEQRPPRSDRPERFDRTDQEQRPQRAERPERPDRPERTDRARRERPASMPAADGDERISLGVLPPAIGVNSAAGEADTPRPRRRVRKPRDEEGDEIAPAA